MTGSVKFLNLYSTILVYMVMLDAWKVCTPKISLSKLRLVMDVMMRNWKLFALGVAEKASNEEKEKISKCNVYMQYVWNNIINCVEPAIEKKYFIPYNLFKPASKIIIYGAGQVGKKIYALAKSEKKIEIVGWLDKNANKLKSEYGDILFEPREVKNVKYEYILIAVEKEAVYKQICNELQELGVKEDVIKWSNVGYKKWII